MHTQAFIAVYSDEQVCPMSLLFIRTSPVKQYSYQNDFSFASKFLVKLSCTVEELWQFSLTDFTFHKLISNEISDNLDPEALSSKQTIRSLYGANMWYFMRNYLTA